MSDTTPIEPRVRLGVMRLLRSVEQEVAVAEACEAAGFWGVGLGDTAPQLYQDVYTTTAACLQATSGVRVGPTVTNTVARHWSVLAATARSFEEMHPGRFFAGIGTGDGALHSVGLAPARWDQLELDVREVRSLGPPDIEIHVAASGPRGAETAGRVASDLLLGTGLDADALDALAARAERARAAAGVTEPLRRWIVAPTFLARDEGAVVGARRGLRGAANGYARFAFAATYADKAVPERFQPILKERLARYDFDNHGTVGDANPNAHLFSDEPEVQDYLLDRMMLIGTAEECSRRLATLARDARLDGVWLALLPTGPSDDPVDLVRTAADAFGRISLGPSGSASR
jgi:alkanesulfonate monooxygenase SsuD/methylene tetrahydromethanopterin reductase-like flavin-dependent oxidoreductase (luciferase family)